MVRAEGMRRLGAALVMAVLGLAGLAVQAALPAEYKELGWVCPATGAEFINTGYTLQVDDAVEVRLNLSAKQPTKWTTVWGCRDANGQSVCFQPHYGDANQTWPTYKWGRVLLTGSNGLFPLETDVTLRCQRETAVWQTEDGTGDGMLTLENTEPAAGLSTLVVFNQNTATTEDGLSVDTGSKTVFRLYSFKVLSDDGTTRVDLVPARRTADAVVGLYDRVSERFLENAAGTGTFWGSDDVDMYASYAKFTPNNYLDTGYKHQSNTEVTFDVKIVEPKETPDKNYRCLFGARHDNDRDHSMGFFVWSTWVYKGNNASMYLRDSEVRGWERGTLITYDTWMRMTCNAAAAQWFNHDDPTVVKTLATDGREMTEGLENWHLNGFNAKGSHGGSMDLAYRFFRISEGDWVARDYRPMYKIGQPAALYDLVEGTANLMELTFGGVCYTLSEDGQTIQLRKDGPVEPVDLYGFTGVEKRGPYSVNAAPVDGFPSLAVEEGELSFENTLAKTYPIAGTLKIAGGTRLVFDMAGAGSDTLAPETLDLSAASAENPITVCIVQGKVEEVPADGLTLIASGLAANDLAKFRAEGLPVTLFVRDGALKASFADKTTVITARWTGAGDLENLADPLNWDCRNYFDDRLEGALPTVDSYVVIPADGCTFNCPPGQTLVCRAFSATAPTVSFGGDCDWRGLDIGQFGAGQTFDLRGHTLQLSLAKELTVAQTVTDTAEQGGCLVLEVPEGVTAQNTQLALAGTLSVRKTGAGTYRSAIGTQSYTGGTPLAAGGATTLAGENDNSAYSLARYNPFGALDTPFQVESGAFFDIAGNYDYHRHEIILNGGTLQNYVRQTKTGWGGLGNIRLTADSTVVIGADTVCSGKPFNLDGHRLTLEIADGVTMYIRENAPLQGEGTLNVTGGGKLHLMSAQDCRTMDLVMGGVFNHEGTLDVRDYTAKLTDDTNPATAALNVYGTFRPEAEKDGQDYFYGCTLQDGATIDLGARTRALPMKSAFTDGANTLAFAEGARIWIDLGARTDLVDGLLLLSWTAETEPPADVQFVQVPAKTRLGKIYRTRRGLLFQKGFSIFLR